MSTVSRIAEEAKREATRATRCRCAPIIVKVFFFFFSVSFHFFLIFSVTQRTLREANAHWTSARVLS